MSWVLTAAVVAMSVTAAVGAQSAKAMHQPSKGDTRSMTYTGCVESVNHGGAFLRQDLSTLTIKTLKVIAKSCS